jgi:hypothetical protein
MAGEKGQTLPIATLIMVVLMGMVAMVVDGGYAYAQQRFMHNAADAAALAAASMVVSGEIEAPRVYTHALRYAMANSADRIALYYLDSSGNVLAESGSGLIPAGTAGVRVDAEKSFRPFFAGVFGLQQFTARATSRAMALAGAMPTSWPGLSPLAVPINFYQDCAGPGHACDLWDPSYGRIWGIPGGDYKSLIDLSLGTVGAITGDTITQWVRDGYPGITNRDQWIPTISGSHGNNVADGLSQRIQASPTGVDPDGVPWGYVDMVIWNQYQRADPQAGTPARVYASAFGRFKVRLTDISGSRVVGYFIKFITPGHQRGDPANPYGPTIIVLGG